jgi:arabinose-5-phosphate isomerase
MTPPRIDIVSELRRVLEIEADALRAMVPRVDGRAAEAVELIRACSGKVVVTGVGKCAHIAAKIASTLASTGTPAVFLHPGDAVHGDLGFVAEGDLALVLSNSGETPEIKALLPYLRQRGLPIVAMTGNEQSTLACAAACVLDTAVREEGDPLNLAPMASTTAMLAMGDAVAATLMRLREFTRDDYARLHPGGSLGQKLLCVVEDLMHVGGQMPIVASGETLDRAILTITSKRLGCTFVTDADGRLLGIVTDGDLRRVLQQNANPLNLEVDAAMTRNPRTVTPDTLAVDALKIMERDSPVTMLPVVDPQNRPVGALHIHDLIRAGIA